MNQEAATKIWNNMTPMQRYELMDRASNALSGSKSIFSKKLTMGRIHRACIKLIMASLVNCPVLENDKVSK
jgi:hypothetical protein